MTMRRRVLRLTVMALAVAFATAATARADGLPVLGIDIGPTGIATPDGTSRYVTIPAGARTVVARVAQDGGRVLASRSLPGNFTIPAVAYDGTASGLSPDAATLVLISPRASFPRARTALIALDARRLRPRRVLDLRGDFSFDAISPDGARIYLIQYLSPLDPTRYQVRSYDLPTRRLLPDAIVDPNEPGERMHGTPVTRAVSPDGRFAYTLYDRPGGAPFVHALDTAEGSARCIDLDLLTQRATSRMRLKVSADGAGLTVLDGGEPAAQIDTATSHVTATTPVAAPATDRPGGHVLQLAIGIGILALLAASAGTRLFHRRRRAEATPSRESWR